MKYSTIAIYSLFIFLLFTIIADASKTPKNFKDPKIMYPYPEFTPPKTTTKIPKDAIWTKEKTAWARITEFGTIKTDSKSTDSLTAHLKNVKTIVTTAFAFTSLSEDGTVFSWGMKKHADAIPLELPEKLQNVQSLFSNEGAFVAISLLETGETRVYSWGDEKAGGFIPEDIQTQLQTPIKQITSTSLAFAALTKVGKVVVWGNPRVGGKIPPDFEFQKSLESNIAKIYSNHGAFVALNNVGNILAWGTKANGGDIPKEFQHKYIKEIFCTNFAFTALTTENVIFSWGHPSYGGRLPFPVKFLNNVKTIFSNYGAFVATFESKNIFAWGHFQYGGEIPEILENVLANKVETIIPQEDGFKAILTDASEIYWGKTFEL